MSQDKKILDISKIREDNKSEVYLSWFFEDDHSFLISYPTTYSLENVKHNIFKFENKNELKNFIKEFNRITKSNLEIIYDFQLRYENLKEPKSYVTQFDELKEEGNNMHDLLISFFSHYNLVLQTKNRILMVNTKKIKKEALNDNWRRIKGINYLYIVAKKNNLLTRKDLTNIEKVKIGITNDFNKRLYDYKTHSPVDIQVISVFPVIDPYNSVAEEIEDRIKNYLSNLNIQQEWYFMRTRDINSIVAYFVFQSDPVLFLPTKFSDKYGDRFFVEFSINKQRKKELLMIENKNKSSSIYLMKNEKADDYINFEKDKVKKLRTFQKYDNLMNFLFDFIKQKQSSFIKYTDLI